jgi:glycosyltransferase involved in cell wall biosynthesis
MIRLCSIQPVAERGGSDQALLRMLRSLPPGSFECHVVVPKDPLLRAELEATGARVHVVPMRRISTSYGAFDWIRFALGWPLAVARLTRLVRRLDIHVVHTNSLHSWYGWAAALLARRPHVWHAREIVVQSRAALRVERFLTRHFCRRLVCVSRAVADQFEPGKGDRGRVVVIHESADPAVFHPGRAGHFRDGAGIADEAPLAGSAGRIDTWKGLDVLLDAWPRARSACAELHFVIAGGAVEGKEAYADALARRARALDGVHWVGSLDETAVVELLADLDVLVLASTEPEPYGLVAVEALACGTPIVATDAGGPREIVATAHPGAGRLVPVGDAGALADAIVASVTTAPTSTAIRRARVALRDPEPEQLSAVFRSVAPDARPRGRSEG